MSITRIIEGKTFTFDTDTDNNSNQKYNESNTTKPTNKNLSVVFGTYEPTITTFDHRWTKCIVHFRPSSDWDGTQYGFDWMRNTDYRPMSSNKEKAKGDISYQQIVSKHYIKGTNRQYLEISGNNYDGEFVTDTKAFNKLSAEYGYSIKLSYAKENEQTAIKEPRNYIYPWLSLLPGQTATLSLIVDAEEDLTAEFVFLENEHFDIQMVTPVGDFKKGDTPLPDAVQITCTSAFDEDQTIIIYTKKRNIKREAGRLQVWANGAAQQKTLKVLTVFVNLPTKDILTIESGQDIPQLPYKELTEQYLQQALIKIDLTDNETLNLGNFIDQTTFDNLYRDKEAIVAYYNTGYSFMNNPRKKRRDRIYNDAPQGYTCLTDFLYDMLQMQLNQAGQNPDKYENHLRLFYIPDPDGCFRAYNANRQLVPSPIGGYWDPGTHNLVIFGEPEHFHMAHELGHALGLNHSFSNQSAEYYTPNALFTYTARLTDNIMDYKVKSTDADQFTFWKWQWEIMNSNVNENGSPRIYQMYKL